MPAEPSKLEIKFLYALCNDVAAMRRFYIELLGLRQNAYQEKAWLACNLGSVDFMIFQWDSPVPVPKEWHWQPGNGQGTLPAMSLSVRAAKENFRALVEKLKAAEVSAQTSEPTWRQNSYWGWTVKDPMGNTIELFCEFKQGEIPTNPHWAEFK